jgi:alpha-glucosidase
MVEEVIAAYDKNDLPLETMYLDIPYMDNYVDFTVNFTAFNKIGSLADSLHNSGRRLVVIIDAAMSAEDVTSNNKFYTKGNFDDIFIKSSLYNSKKYNGNLIASVWPKTAVFIDWFNK